MKILTMALVGVVGLCIATPTLAESPPQRSTITIYPAHAAPADMTMAEQALHRRATEVAIWSMPLMNYKAMYDALHDVVGMNYNGDVVYHSQIQDWKRALATPNRRGSLYYAIFSSIKHYGPGSFYLDVAKDEDDNWLDGGKNYQLTVDADVPVRQFWALTAYDLKTAAFIRNMPSAGVSSIDEGLEVNGDGTVDLYMGPKPPKGKEGNWIPTAEGQQYYMLFRFYGAEDPVFTRTWQLNDLELVD